MKKVLPLILIVLLLLTLCACSETSEPYTVDVGIKDLEVDPVAQTITDKYKTYQYTYQYEIAKTSNEYTVTITYPDGSTYYETHRPLDSEFPVAKGYSDDSAAKRYISAHHLIRALQEEVPEIFYPENPVLGLILISLGLLYIALPHRAWWLMIGWLLKDAEPSEFSMIFLRVFGVGLLLFGIIKLFIA